MPGISTEAKLFDMVRLVLQLDDEVKRKLEALADLSGHRSIEEFLQEKLSSEVDEDFGAPPHLSFSSDEELEAMLLERIDSDESLIEFTPELMEQIKRRALGDRK